MDVYNLLFNCAFGLYCLSVLISIISFIRRNNSAGSFAFFTVLSGFLVHTCALIVRTISLSYLPISSLHESLSFFAWAVMLIYILIQRKQRSFIHGVFVQPLAMLLMGVAFLLDSRMRPLLPVLKSYWLGIHVFLCFFGYASFSLSCVFGLMYILQEREIKYKKIDTFFFRLPSLELSDRIGYRAVVFGFIFLSLGIISGSIWAQKAWGAFWSWDPKEVWSLIMWLFYVVYLHGRLIRGWQGRKSAYLAIIGFFIMLFTYLGVSLILPGLHAYL